MRPHLIVNQASPRPDLPGARTLRAAVLEAEAPGPEPVLLDVDGEQPGMLPARFAILRGALRARVEAASA